MENCSAFDRAQCPHGTYGETFAVYADPSECWKLKQLQTSKPTTNADRIRDMSDEELAAFMFSMVDCVSCENKLMNNGKLVFGDKRKTCTDKDYHAMCNGDGRKCEAVCLEWLRQPAKEANQ